MAEHNPTPNFTVDVSAPGLVYDQTAQKIAWTATQNVNCALDEDGVATAVASSGNEKYLSLFAEYVRDLSDPRTDRNGATVYFDRAESFSLNIVQGVEAPTGTATKPGLRSDQILLTDILITYGMTQIFNADLDDDRAQYPIDLTGSPLTVKSKGLQEALQGMLDQVNNAALLSGNNTFTGTNTFSNDVLLSDDVTFDATSVPVFASEASFEDNLVIDGNIVLSANATPDVPRLFLDKDLTTISSDYVCIGQFSDHGSGDPNLYLYVNEDGFMLAYGFHYAGSNQWAYDTGVTVAYGLRIGANGLSFLRHSSGSSPWDDADANWTDAWAHVDDSGFVIDNSGNDINYLFGQSRTVVKNLALGQGLPVIASGAAGWDYTNVLWDSNSNSARIQFPLLLPINVNVGTVTVDVLVTPGAARTGTDRVRVWLTTNTPDWSTPAAPSLSTVDETYDNGTTNIQLITVSGDPSVDDDKAIYIDVKAGNDGATNTDKIHAIRVSYTLDGVPMHSASV